MKFGVALVLVIAFPTVAAAQYGFQLRPSPYRVLSGWERDANTRGPATGRSARAATPVSERKPNGRDGIRPDVRNSDVTGSTRAPN